MPLNSLKSPFIHTFKMGEFMVCKLPINKTVKNLKGIFSRKLSLLKSCLSLSLYSYYFLWKLFENLLDTHAEQTVISLTVAKTILQKSTTTPYFPICMLLMGPRTKGPFHWCMWQKCLLQWDVLVTEHQDSWMIVSHSSLRFYNLKKKNSTLSTNMKHMILLPTLWLGTHMIGPIPG